MNVTPADMASETDSQVRANIANAHLQAAATAAECAAAVVLYNVPGGLRLVHIARARLAEAERELAERELRAAAGTGDNAHGAETAEAQA